MVLKSLQNSTIVSNYLNRIVRSYLGINYMYKAKSLLFTTFVLSKTRSLLTIELRLPVKSDESKLWPLLCANHENYCKRSLIQHAHKFRCAHSWSDILTFVPPSTYSHMTTDNPIAPLTYDSHLFLPSFKGGATLNSEVTDTDAVLPTLGKTFRPLRRKNSRKNSGSLVILLFWRHLGFRKNCLCLCEWSKPAIVRPHICPATPLFVARVKLCGQTIGQLAILSDGVRTACTVFWLCC